MKTIDDCCDYVYPTEVDDVIAYSKDPKLLIRYIQKDIWKPVNKQCPPYLRIYHQQEPIQLLIAFPNYNILYKDERT